MHCSLIKSPPAFNRMAKKAMKAMKKAAKHDDDAAPKKKKKAMKAKKA